MSDRFLHRGDAPFSDSVWSQVDEAVVNAARGQLCGRKLLHLEGPHGLGLKALPGAEAVVEESEEVSVSASSSAPLPLVQSALRLSARDIAAFESVGLPLDLGPVSRAAVACARKEDEIVFNGAAALGLKGLLNVEGAQAIKLNNWDEVGQASLDIIQAVTKLDAAGCHGPYALALAPSLYNLLFRRYPQGNMVELDHVRSLAAKGVVKAPAIAKGGVLLAHGAQFASIVLGQDLTTSFVGPAGRDYEFCLSESLVVRILQPEAVCVLK